MSANLSVGTVSYVPKKSEWTQADICLLFLTFCRLNHHAPMRFSFRLVFYWTLVQHWFKHDTKTIVGSQNHVFVR